MSAAAADLLDNDAGIFSVLVVAGVIAKDDEGGSGLEIGIITINGHAFVDERRTRKDFNARLFAV